MTCALLGFNKGSAPSYSPDITLSSSSGQYMMSATVRNLGTTDGAAQVLFYWAQKVNPATTPNVLGYGFGAYVQPYIGTNPTSPPVTVAAGNQTPPISLIWMPDWTVFNSISTTSPDPYHILIIAQVISIDPANVHNLAYPADLNWAPGTNCLAGWTSNCMVAAGRFSWP